MSASAQALPGGDGDAVKDLSLRRAPRQARAQETVRAVLVAAGEEIELGGLDRLTTNRIAARAGLSIGTVYGYFPNKEAILGALLGQWLEAVYQAIDSMHPRFGGGLDLISYLQTQIYAGARFYEEQVGLTALPYLSEGVPALHEVVRQHDARVYESVASALRHYAPDAQRADIDAMARCLPRMVHAGLIAAIVEKEADSKRAVEFLRAAVVGMASRLLSRS